MHGNGRSSQIYALRQSVLCITCTRIIVWLNYTATLFLLIAKCYDCFVVSLPASSWMGGNQPGSRVFFAWNHSCWVLWVSVW